MGNIAHAEKNNYLNSFENCKCLECEKTSYSVTHQYRPLILPVELTRTAEMLLWYIPNNTSSAQSFVNEYLKDPVFEDAVLQYLLAYLKLSDQDLCFIDAKCIPPTYIDPYKGKVSSECRKIIAVKNKKETKLACIIRHLRSSLVHGRFNLLSDRRIIGFDFASSGKKPAEGTGYTALFDLDIQNLYAFCRQLIEYPDYTISQLLQNILMKNGFTVKSNICPSFNNIDNDGYEELVFARKGNTAYRINCSRYLHRGDFYNLQTINECSLTFDNGAFGENTPLINIFYTEKLRTPCLKSNRNTWILSKKGLRNLFLGQDNLELLR